MFPALSIASGRAILFSLFAAFALSSNALSAPGIKISCSSRVITVPPNVSDPALAEQIAVRVSRQYTLASKRKNNRDACSPFISYQESASEMDRVGYSANFQPEVKSMGAKQVRLISERTGATHLIEIMVAPGDLQSIYEGTQSVFQVQVKYHALDPDNGSLELAGQDSSEVSLPGQGQQAGRSSAVMRWLSRVSPNALSISSGGSRFHHTILSRNPGKVEVLDSRSRGVLPPLVSSIGFSKIEHPDAYQMFDYNFSLFPGSRLLLANDEITLKLISNADPQTESHQESTHQVSLKYTAVCGYGVGQMSLFNPLGTSYFSLGYGPCLISNQSKGRLGNLYPDSSFVVQFGHRFFLTKSFFVGLEAEALTFSRDIYKDDQLVHNSGSRGSLTLGYYLSDAEGRFTRTWRDVSR